MTAGERSMLDGIDKIRHAHGLPPLRDLRVLCRSAGNYSRFMLRSDYFGHVGSVRVSRRFGYAGEALELHRGWRTRRRRALRAWMRSPTHRAVILSPRARFVGVGMARGRFRGRLASTWTLHVAR